MDSAHRAPRGRTHTHRTQGTGRGRSLPLPNSTRVLEKAPPVSPEQQLHSRRGSGPTLDKSLGFALHVQEKIPTTFCNGGSVGKRGPPSSWLCLSSGPSIQLVLKQKLHQTALQAGDGHSFSCFKLEVESAERIRALSCSPSEGLPAPRVTSTRNPTPFTQETSAQLENMTVRGLLGKNSHCHRLLEDAFAAPDPTGLS